MFQITLGQIVSWLVVGVLCGTAAGAIYTRSRAGFGLWMNLAFGLAGALLAGILIGLLNVHIEPLERVNVSLQDLVVGILGSLLVIFGYNYWRSRRGKAQTQSEGSAPAPNQTGPGPNTP